MFGLLNASSGKSGSCGFPTGDLSEAVACDSGSAISATGSDFSAMGVGSKLSRPLGISDVSISSPDFRFEPFWTLEISCLSACESELVEIGKSSLGTSSLGTSMADRSLWETISPLVSAINFELPLLLPCQARMLAVASAISKTIRTMPLDQCSHQVRCGAACGRSLTSIACAVGWAEDSVTAAKVAVGRLAADSE